MNNIALAFTSIVVIVSVGLFHSSLRRVITEFFIPLRDLGQSGIAVVAGTRANLETQYRGIRESYGMGESGSFWGYVFGAILFSVLFALFSFADLSIIAMTIGGMLGEGSFEYLTHLLPSALSDPAVVITLTLLTAGGFWGLILFDIAGLTKLAPWESMTVYSRRILTIATIASLMILFFLTIALGVFRFQLLLAPVPIQSATVDINVLSVESANSEPMPTSGDLPDPSMTTIQKFATGFTVIGLPILATTSSLVAMIGPYMLFVFGILVLNKIMQYLFLFVQIFITILFTIITIVWGVFDATLEFVSGVANFLVSPLRSLLKPEVAAKTDLNLVVGARGARTDANIPEPSVSIIQPAPTTDPIMDVMDISPSLPQGGSKNWNPFAR